MNRCLQEAHVPEWITKGKTILPTDDVENINSTNKRRDLLLANKP